MKKYSYNYDKNSDIMGIIFPDRIIKEDSSFNTVEVFPDVYVSIDEQYNKIFCIEIWDISKRNIQELNRFLRKNYDVYIKTPLA